LMHFYKRNFSIICDTMPGSRASSRRKSSSKETSIKSFFTKETSSVTDEAVKDEKCSPGKTSDYESEGSRSTTPSTDPSRSTTPSSSSVTEDGDTRDNSQETDVKNKKDNELKTDVEESSVKVKREVAEAKEEDEDDMDIFATANEEEDDKNDVKAALMTGLLSSEVKMEEERVAEETRRLELQEEAKRKQELAKEQELLSTQQRFERLQKLLGKSKFYSDFLLNKMKSHEASMELKKQAMEARTKKRAEMSQDAEDETKKGGKRGRKRDNDGPKNKKMKIGDEAAATSDQSEVAKNRNEHQRKFEGKDIPANQPLLLTGGIMRSYQLEGYEWMATLWENGINGILADEMGLGKTIQTVALFCHMYEMGVSGPFLVVAPLSTVPNWVNEFKRFAPTVPVVLYHGNAQERLEKRGELKKVVKSPELDGKTMMNVVVTSYEIAMNDRAAFSSIRWRYIVVDEGHRLKNMNCRLIRELKQYHSANRLLLTGTPLQNNLSELWSLLNFLLPEIFDDLRVFESWFDAKDLHENDDELKRITAQEQKNSILSTLHQILTPFLLRRVKTDVDLQIPPKKEVMVYCPMTSRQKDLYRATVEKTLGDLLNKDKKKKDEEVLPEKRKRTQIDYSVLLDEKEYADDDKFEEHLAKFQEYQASLSKANTPASAYIKEMERLEGNEKNFSVKSRMMDMRKSVNHPYLIEYPVTEDGMFYDSGPDMVDICGKLQVLDQMIVKLMKDGHKTLIFSQMTKMLDILGDYCNFKKWKFCRLDGGMNFIDRQENIDKFNTDPEYCIFLLSTRAGGLGINLTAADTCIIYDSDWNPQQDLQAQDRCHRIGQTRPVMIYRLVTANTIDQKIVERAAAKRKLEKMIIHKSKFKAGAENVKSSLQSISPHELLALLDSKDYIGSVVANDKYNGQIFSDEQLEKLLDRSDITWGLVDKEEEPKMKKEASTGVKGVFQVLEVEEKNPDLGSVKE